MSFLDIRVYPDPILNIICKPVKKITVSIVEFAREMADTMYYKDKGIGLAAPQVGENFALIVVDFYPDKQVRDPLFLLNPRIIIKNGSEIVEEGCLSLPNCFVKVERATEVTVEGLNLEGALITIEAKGLLARCLQHEIDHLNGRLLLDYISPLKRNIYKKRCLKELKKVKKWKS